MDDIELLREFASQQSEEAFRAVVDRHIDFVYAVALRQLGDAHAAKEVAQVVFIDLARKAAVIPPNTVLSGWLFRAARFAAANTVRAENRRKRREWEAAQMEPTFHESKMESPWQQMEPLLNEALEELSENDRSALLLRFFDKKPLREVGVRLGLNEDAAKKRVARAVEKLRLIFHRRGIATSSTVLLAALSTQTIQAAPAGLAASIATDAVLEGTALATSSVTLGKGMLSVMAISKLKTTLVATAALLLAGGTTTYVVVNQSRTRPPETAAAMAESADDALALEIIASMNSRSLDAAPPLVFLRVHNDADGGNQTGAITSNAKVMGRAASLRELLATAYGTTQSRLRMEGPAWSGKRFDYLVSLPSGQKEAFQQIIRDKLGLTAQWQTRLEDIYVLSARAGEFPGLQPTVQQRRGSSMNNTDGQLTFNNATVDSFARALDRLIQRPVVNETGLQDRFDIFLTWGEPGERQPDPEALKQALAEQLGFELTPDKRDMEILLVQNLKHP